VDEQAKVTGVQRRRSRTEIEELVAEYETSGLSCVEFCRKQGLSLATLARYRKRRAQGEVVAGNRWVAVELSAGRPPLGSGANSALTVALPGGLRIEVGRGFDASTLGQLLGVLGRV
jgi:hypothetical protein